MLRQQFSNFSVHHNNLQLLEKHKLLGLTQGLCPYLSGVGPENVQF